MNQEMISVIESVSNEKGLSKEQLLEAIESALSAAAQTRENRDKFMRVQIDRDTGEFVNFRCWDVVADEDLENEESQMTISKASKQYPDIAIGDVIETKLDNPVVYGRIAAQVAKKVIQQKLREAEGEQIVENYANLTDEIVRGVVRYIEPTGVTLDLGSGAQVFVPKNDLIPTDTYRINDRTQCLLTEVRSDGRPPFLIGSRTHNTFLEKLFTVEVPEIAQKHIKIINCVREPGVRAKIAVQSLDPKLDPIGSCVGIRGSRVQSISNELANERIEVVLWNDNLAQFVLNAMAPAEVKSIEMDEEARTIDVIVTPDNLSKAIGKDGLNVRLASELTKCRLNVMDTAEAESRSIERTNNAIELFRQKLSASEDVAKILVDEGLYTIEDVAYAEISQLKNIEEFDSNLAEELHSRANDSILEALMDSNEEVFENLSDIGISEEVIAALNESGIDNPNAFAELSVPDLLDIVPTLDESIAKDWIMRARTPFLDDSNQSS